MVISDPPQSAQISPYIMCSSAVYRETDRQTDRQTDRDNKPKAILADQHFQKNVHRFNKHARFTIIYRLTNTNLDKEILRERLIQRENCGYKN